MSELTIASCLVRAKALEHVSDSARLDAEILLSHVLEKDRTYLYTWPEHYVSSKQQQAFSALIERRIQGVPVAYLTGYKDFWKFSLLVNSSTLIPRPDTELLVETALHCFDDAKNISRQVIDLGTGTGAIALALAAEKPQWQVLAIDNSFEACELAEKNRQLNNLDNISISCGHWLEATDIVVDMIVSNPPYIDERDPHLSQGDVSFEPRTALVAADNGLADFDSIAQQAKHRLNVGGYLLFEHGYQQAQAVVDILMRYGYEKCFTVNDLAGHPRVSGGCVLHQNNAL